MQRWGYIAAAAALSLCAAARADDPVPATPAPAEPPAAAAPDNSPPAPKGSAVQTVAPDVAEAILGRRVTDAEGKDVGRLVDVLVDENAQPQAAVIDFGGFLGVGSRKVAVHWSTLHFKPAEGKHIINLDMSPEQIKAAPEYLSADKPAAVVMPADAAPIAR